MTFGQLIEYSKRNILLQKSCRKWGRETSPRPLFIFWKSVIQGRSQCAAASFHYISIAHKLAYNKNEPYQTLRLLMQRYTEFWFLGKVFLHYILCIIFQQKRFSCYILLTDQISLSDCLYFLRYWVICVLQLFVNQTVTSYIFELILSF